MAKQTSEAEAVKSLGDDARQAWRLYAERMQRIIRELDGSTALDSSVITPGKIRIGDQAHIVDN